MPFRQLAILTLGVFVIGTELFIFGGILPDVARDLGVSTALGGQLVTVFGLTYALGAPFLASSLSRLTRRRVLGWSMGAFTLANLATALASGYPGLLVLRAVSALAACLFVPNAVALVAETSPPGVRGRNLGIVMGGLSLATVLGVPLGIAVNAWVGWRWVFATVAALSLAELGLVLLLPAGMPGRKEPWRSRLAPLVSGRYLGILGASVTVIAAAFAPYTYLVPVLKEPAGLEDGGFALGLALYGVTGVVGAWAGGKAADRWGSRKALSLSLGLLALVFLVLGLAAPGPVTAFLVLVLWGAAGSAFTPVQQHRLIEAGPGPAAGALALNGSAVYLGQTLAASLGAVALTTLGPRTLPLVSAGLVAAVLALVLVRPQGSSPANAGPDAGASSPRGRGGTGSS